jgi:hypothetical protein
MNPLVELRSSREGRALRRLAPGQTVEFGQMVLPPRPIHSCRDPGAVRRPRKVGDAISTQHSVPLTHDSWRARLMSR